MYKEIFYFNVEDALRNGQHVRLIDKAQGIIIVVNNMTVDEFYSKIEEIKADKTSRYELYVREEGENDDD